MITIGFQVKPLLRLLLLQLLLLLSLSMASGSILKYNWTNGTLCSDMAKIIRDYESTCHDEVYYHGLRNEGMGSDFHVWSQALCNSMQWGVSMNVANFTWIWNDVEFCGNSTFTTPINCYFEKPNPCPVLANPPFVNWNNKLNSCRKYIVDENTRAIFRASAMEYLFSRVSHRIYNATEYAAREVFNLDNGGHIPQDMIAVHVRWGDKVKEMKLVGADEYVKAIKTIVSNYSISNPSIYLVTENSDALDLIKKELSAINSTWRLFAHGHFMTDWERKQGDHVPTGRIGKANMVSLLLAMESRYYILTTGSNWSRILNELRTNVVDPVCNKCTAMIDLQHEGFHNNWRRKQ